MIRSIILLIICAYSMMLPKTFSQKAGTFHRYVHDWTYSSLTQGQIQELKNNRKVIVKASLPNPSGGKPGWEGSLKFYLDENNDLKSVPVGKWYHYSFTKDDLPIDSYDFYSQNGVYLGNKTYTKSGTLFSKDEVKASDNKNFKYEIHVYSYSKEGQVKDTITLYSNKSNIQPFNPYKWFKKSRR